MWDIKKQFVRNFGEWIGVYWGLNFFCDKRVWLRRIRIDTKICIRIRFEVKAVVFRYVSYNFLKSFWPRFIYGLGHPGMVVRSRRLSSFFFYTWNRFWIFNFRGKEKCEALNLAFESSRGPFESNCSCKHGRCLLKIHPIIWHLKSCGFKALSFFDLPWSTQWTI